MSDAPQVPGGSVQIDVQTLQEWLKCDHPPLLLDVREAWEVALARIEPASGRGATLGTALQSGSDAGLKNWRHLPMSEVTSRYETLDRAQPIVCYCHHGMRSLQVVAFLMHHGFDSVYNLVGGIDAWSQMIDPSVPRY